MIITPRIFKNLRTIQRKLRSEAEKLPPDFRLTVRGKLVGPNGRERQLFSPYEDAEEGPIRFMHFRENGIDVRCYIGWTRVLLDPSFFDSMEYLIGPLFNYCRRDRLPRAWQIMYDHDGSVAARYLVMAEFIDALLSGQIDANTYYPGLEAADTVEVGDE